jgi:hypothetical protein
MCGAVCIIFILSSCHLVSPPCVLDHTGYIAHATAGGRRVCYPVAGRTKHSKQRRILADAPGPGVAQLIITALATPIVVVAGLLLALVVVVGPPTAPRLALRPAKFSLAGRPDDDLSTGSQSLPPPARCPRRAGATLTDPRPPGANPPAAARERPAFSRGGRPLAWPPYGRGPACPRSSPPASAPPVGVHQSSLERGLPGQGGPFACSPPCARCSPGPAQTAARPLPRGRAALLCRAMRQIALLCAPADLL